MTNMKCLNCDSENVIYANDNENINEDQLVSKIITAIDSMCES